MSTVYVISHPEVQVDPAVPVPGWGLSDKGRMRMRAFAASPRVKSVTSIWASQETKATQAAQILADALALPVRLDAALRENDRSATGFLPPKEFEQVADAFFAEPTRPY